MSERSRPNRWPLHWPNISDPLVLAAMKAVPRHLFVPPQYRGDAYEDIPLPIGYGQTISQPYIVALMTQALCLTRESRVLEIGTGSGYQAAILAHITPYVWSVETLPELARAAEERLRGLGYAVQVRLSDGRFGWPEYAPYDAAIVTAAAPDVPPALVAQLKDGGRLVIPVGESGWGQTLWLLVRVGNKVRHEFLGEVRFVPLVAVEAPPQSEDPALEEIRHGLERLTQRSW